MVARILAASPGADPERIRRFRDDEGFVVTTGQQPGLLTGPLFAVYKALTTVSLARTLERTLERPVLPVFWVASEDHDWAEADHTWLLDLENRPRALRAAPAEDPGERPVFRVPLEDPGPLVEQLSRWVPDNDFRPRCIRLLTEAYPSGSTLPSGFAETLATLLSGSGLHVVQAHDPALKQQSAEFLGEIAGRSAEIEELLRRRSRDLEGAGFHVQVPVLDGATNVFLERAAGRDRLYRDGSGFRTSRGGERVSAEELAVTLRDDPARVSPNVFARPLVEARVFPVLAYVAGPAETAYYAQIAPTYDALDTPMPVIHPRAAVTVIEAKIRKVLNKLGLEPSQLERTPEQIASDLARDDVPDDVAGALSALRGAIGSGSAELERAARSIDPTLKGPVTQSRNAAFKALTDVEKKIVQAIKRRNQITMVQVEKARANLVPDGVPQERRLNVIQYLSRYGDEFLETVAAEIDARVERSLLSGVSSDG